MSSLITKFNIETLFIGDLFTYKHILKSDLEDAVQCNNRKSIIKILNALNIVEGALLVRLFIYRLEIEKELLYDASFQNEEEIKYAS